MAAKIANQMLDSVRKTTESKTEGISMSHVLFWCLYFKKSITELVNTQRKVDKMAKKMEYRLMKKS